MAGVVVTVLGCGDAFNSGGRLFPCFHVRATTTTFLIDCGPTALLAMKQLGIDPDSIDAVLLSHFHGDHFAGLPFLELEFGILRRRERSLVIAGPHGVEKRVPAVMDTLYPGTRSGDKVRTEYVTWRADGPVDLCGAAVRAYPAVHTPETEPHMLRIAIDGRTIAYSGDTEWTPALIEAARGADLLICEASTFSTRVKNHLDFETLMSHRAELECESIVITHMSDEMLAHLPVDGVTAAEDGLAIEL